MAINSKKRKRALENYIKKKLKKEETDKLLSSLSKSCWSSDLLLSSKRLGQKESRKQVEKKKSLLSSSLKIGNNNELKVDGKNKESENNSIDNVHQNGKKSQINRPLTQSVLEDSDSDFDSDLETSDEYNGSDDEKKENRSNNPHCLLESEELNDIQDQNTAKLTRSNMDVTENDPNGLTYLSEDFNSSSPLSVENDVTKTFIQSVDDDLDDLPIPIKKMTREEGQISPSSIQKNSNATTRTFVPVRRLEYIQQSREALPIYMEESSILEMVSENSSVVICGETGSGKTTQVPQFLYEAGYAPPNKPGKILITQPRRMATISMAKRVAEEMNDASIVGYQIRYQKEVSEKNKIIFMTDGLLLKIIESDFLLSQYNVIIIDEAHERNVNTDILIGLLSRIVPLRSKMFQDNQCDVTTGRILPPLKLIVMSATLNIHEFTENHLLFPSGPPPVIHIASRQFPITIHYSRKTPLNYMDAAYKKVLQIHSRLPSGNILVFVTGQSEVWHLVKRLKKSFPQPTVIDSDISSEDCRKQNENKTFLFEEEKSSLSSKLKEYQGPNMLSCYNEDNEFDDVSSLSMENSIAFSKEIECAEKRNFQSFNILNPIDAELDVLNGDTDELLNDDDLENEDGLVEMEDGGEYPVNNAPLVVLPLYSLLSVKEQLKVFQLDRLYDSSYRVCIVSTNVAETSITIPGIKYVVDTGRVKERIYRKGTVNGSISTTTQMDSPGDYLERYKISWISKASANQRAGRAGRCDSGHIYRLYSRPVFYELFDEHSVPEICKIPLDPLVLSMKSMGLDNVVHFPFPTSPNSSALAHAEMSLLLLGALELKKKNKLSKDATLMDSDDFKVSNENLFGTVITELGRKMSVFPLSPRLSKLLVQGNKNGCLPYIVNLVSALSLEDPFSSDVTNDEEFEKESNSEEELSSHPREFSNIKSVEKWNGSKPVSDIIRLLTIFCAFEYEPESKRESFCLTHGLRLKTLKEMSLLRDQLIRTIDQYFGIKISCYQLTPPSQSQIQTILKLYISAYADHMARLTDAPIPLERYGGKKVYAYQTIDLNSDVMNLLSKGNFDKPQDFMKISSNYALIDRSSCIYPIKSLPKWIVFEKKVLISPPNMDQSVEGNGQGKIVLKNCSIIIDEDWIASCVPLFCHFSKPLMQPDPFYCREIDTVCCFSVPKFVGNWTLPICQIPYPSSKKWQSFWTAPNSINNASENIGSNMEFGEYKWFGKLLLEGEIIEGLKEWKDKWTSPTSTMIKPYSFSKIVSLYTTLAKSNVNSRKTLANALQNNPKYLLRELLLWLPNHLHVELSDKWSIWREMLLSEFR